MKTIFKSYAVLTLTIGAMLMSSSALAYTLTAGGQAVAGEGYTTSVIGATVIDFNSGSLPAEYFGGAVVSGDSGGKWAAPPGDDSYYYTVGNYSSTPGVGVLSLGSLTRYFGFFGGSPDTYNSIEFYNGTEFVGSFTGTDLYQEAFEPDGTPNGNQSQGAYWNIWAENASEYFDTVKFISMKPDGTGYIPANAFETDNHAYLAAVPIPAAAWLFVSGIVGLMGFSTRRKSA